MDEIRIAYVRYLNTAPLVHGLERARGVRLIPAAPSHIADLVRRGEADLGLASVVDAFGTDLAVVGGGMIGCDGPTLTVRVFSSVPIERMTTLAADTDSHTSVVLARVLLETRYGTRVRVVSFDARERVVDGGPVGGEGDWPESVLLIGDKVVVDRPPAGRYPHELDLGEAWRAWTGLPFVYATWMCRAEDVGSERVVMARELVDRQRRHNATRLDWIVSERARGARWPEDLAREYLGRLLKFDFDARARAGLVRFAEEARGIGAVESSEIVWAEGVGMHV